jgi:DNA topoisomerase-3
MISYGSCQFPTLGFIVERYKAIQDFVRENFWKLKVVWELNEEERVEFLWKRHHLFDQTVVQILLEKYLLLLSTKIQVLLVLIKFILL